MAGENRKSWSPWRKRLREASFRGINFFVETSQVEVGRRTVVHEYPFRDKPYAEDMGKAADQFIVNGYVIQNDDNGRDYLEDKRRLIEALKKPGPGKLVLPYPHSDGESSEMWVNVVKLARIVENVTRGGMARFQMVFQEAGENLQPDTEVNFSATLEALITLSLSVWADEFATNYQVNSGPMISPYVSTPDYLATKAEEVMDAGLTSVRGVVQTVPKTFTPSSITPFITDLESIRDNLSSLVYTPTVLYSSLSDLLCQIPSLVPLGDKPLAGMEAGIKIADFGNSLSDPPRNIPIREQEWINQYEIVDAFRNLAIAQAIQVAVDEEEEFSSYEEMLDARDRIAEIIETQTLRASDRSHFDTGDYLHQIQADFVRAMDYSSSSLSKLTTYEVLPAPMSALHLAYEKYYDSDRNLALDKEQDIIDRNSIVQHPGFLPEGETLTILNE